MTGKGMKLSSFTKYLRLRVINIEGPARVAWRAGLVAALFILLSCPANSQDAGTRPTKGEAQAAWDRGDIEKAYNQYNGLLLLYTRDPLYQFYTGACLVRLERDIQRAVTLLSSAINSSVNIKSVPPEVWFYYGRALQMSGNFSQARDAYERFEKVAGKKNTSVYDLQRYIDQCNAGTGAVRLDESSVPTAKEKAALEKLPVAPAQAETAGKISKAEEMVPVSGRPVISGDTAGIPVEYFQVLGKALEHTDKADSLLLALEESRSIDENRTPVMPEATAEPGQLGLFEIKNGQAYSEAAPVPVDPEMPSGLIYAIQIAAFRNDVAPSLFRGLFPVFGMRRQGSEAVYYYTGMFRRIDDARKALPEARGAGFADAFIIAMMEGTQVSMERAALLEKEWGSRPLTGTIDKSAGRPVPMGTLSFRAEVTRISTPVKPEMVRKIELLAGIRGLDMIKNSEGETVFLIGNFITFESAEDYVSLLIRNGYGDARVAAYVGMQEIPVEAARELLKKLPDD